MDPHGRMATVVLEEVVAGDFLIEVMDLECPVGIGGEGRECRKALVDDMEGGEAVGSIKRWVIGKPE